MAEVPALHFKRYWDQSLLVITIFSSWWQPAVRKPSRNSGDSPALPSAEHAVVLSHCPQSRKNCSRPLPRLWADYLTPALPLWTCLLMTGLCLPLIWWLRVQPEPQTCLITRSGRASGWAWSLLPGDWKSKKEIVKEIVSNLHKRHNYIINSEAGDLEVQVSCHNPSPTRVKPSSLGGAEDGWV